MQTDELRAELAELAREVDPFTEDLPAIRRRVARRRVASASVAAVLVAGLVAGGIALTRPSPNHIHIAASAKEVAIAELPRFDAAVVLPAGATDADAARVQAILDSTTAVEKYAALPASTLANVFQFQTAGSKLLHERACTNPSTRSYAVELARGVGDPLAQLTTAVGVAATVQPVGRPLVDIDVFMQLKATPAQIDAVTAAITSDPDVVKSTFLGRQDALREFRRLFANQPDLIANTTANDLPISFQLEVRDDVSPQAVAQRFQMPGVNVAQVQSTQLWAHPGGVTLHDACTRNP